MSLRFSRQEQSVWLSSVIQTFSMRNVVYIRRSSSIYCHQLYLTIKTIKIHYLVLRIFLHHQDYHVGGSKFKKNEFILEYDVSLIIDRGNKTCCSSDTGKNCWKLLRNWQTHMKPAPPVIKMFFGS